MLKIFYTLLDYIFYKKCYFCAKKAKKNITCDKCLDKIKAKGSKKTRKISGIKIEGYYFYKDEIQKLIRGVKYHDKKEFAGDIAGILVEFAGNEHFSAENAEIIPVPMHHKRQKKRRYNHMELISEELSAITGYKVNTELIKRIKNTKPQYKLNQTERRKNLKDAFKVNPAAYSGKKLIIFDDISTTGVTMESIIEELRKHNINNLTGLVIAFA